MLKQREYINFPLGFVQLRKNRSNVMFLKTQVELGSEARPAWVGVGRRYTDGGRCAVGVAEELRRRREARVGVCALVTSQVLHLLLDVQMLVEHQLVAVPGCRR